MIIKNHIKQIENLLNKEKINKYHLLQTSFDIACVKLQLSNNENYIAKFILNNKIDFNPIKSEADNLIYLNKKFDFFPKIINFNDNYLIIKYLKNNDEKPQTTNSDFLESVIKIHSVSSSSYGFRFNTQIGALEQINDLEKNWVRFFAEQRLSNIFEKANQKENMGKNINDKITFILNHMKNLIPDKPTPLLLHGDLWEGNILFNNKKFVGFIDPGSFYGHNEMEVAYLRWFSPSFVDSNFLEKYNDYITIEKNYLSYEPVYQLYYALCNVALWDKSYIDEVKKLLKKLKL